MGFLLLETFSFAMSIEVKNLTKIYGEQRAVNDISFKIGNGEIVGFLGPNGAGKSTTMKMLTCFLQSDSGQAFISGKDVAKQPLETKQKIGYLPESNALYYDMYVREYLAFVGNIYKIKNCKTQAENCIARVGLTLEANKKIGQLSKGYKQRVGLAAAIIHNPEVLILDEPTSGLDPNQIVEIREVIKQLGQDKTVLFSSHIMQEVQAICSRAIIINKGILVADDQLENLQKGNKNELTVTFIDPLGPEWLRNLPAISQVEKIQANQYKVLGKDIQLIRKQLMQLALDNNLNIVSMQESGGNLEDVFRELTFQK
jgi:ABC-2 type transport system ATP-binding protein